MRWLYGIEILLQLASADIHKFWSLSVMVKLQEIIVSMLSIEEK